jgi:hypothetical protein
MDIDSFLINYMHIADGKDENGLFVWWDYAQTKKIYLDSDYTAGYMQKRDWLLFKELGGEHTLSPF